MERTLANLKQLPKLQLPSQTPKLVELPKIEAVPQLPRLTTWNGVSYAAEQRRLAAAQAAAEAQAKATSYKQLTGIKDPNDPYTLNSASDAIFNRKAKELRYGEFAETMHQIPILGDFLTSIVAGADVSVVSPTANILKGDFKALGINALTDLTESMDILANPVKSLVTPLVNKNTEDPKYQMPWYKRLGSGFGFTEDGRYNYDYDTGFWLSDMGLEMISDPINVILTILTWGGAGAAKAAGSSIGKSAAKEVAEEVAETVTKAGVKVVLKKGAEATAEVIKKKVAKNIIKKTVKKALSLKKICNVLSSKAKALAKNSGDDALKLLVQNLDTALASSKGIVDDTVNGIIKQISKSVSTIAKENLDNTTINLVKQLTSSLDEFDNISKYSMKDFILQLIGDSTDAGNIKLKKASKKTAKILRKQLKETTDSDKLKVLKEQLEALFSDPASIKKYKNTFNVDNFADLVDNFKEIPFTDYLNKLNAQLQRSRALQLSFAMDKLAQGPKAVDEAILKMSFFSASPLAPLAAKTIKPGLGALSKIVTNSLEKVGKYTFGWLIKRMDSVDKFFKDKFGNVAVLAYRDMVEAYTRVFKEFDIFSGSKLANSGFEKELAQSIYNDSFKWLRGYGLPNDYDFTVEEKIAMSLGAMNSEDAASKPINVLIASAEEQKNQIWNRYKPEFIKLGITEDEAVEFFYKELDKMGQLGFGIEPLQDWSIVEYVKQLQVNDAILTARNAYKDFNLVLKHSVASLNSRSSVLTYSRDFDIKYLASSKSSLSKANNILITLEAETDNFSSIGIRDFINKFFPYETYKSHKRRHRQKLVVNLKNFNEAVHNASFEAQKFEELRILKSEAWVLEAQNLAATDALKKLQGAASQVRAYLVDFAKVDTFKDTPLAELYEQINKIASPYFGQRYQTNFEINNYLEIITNPRLKTIDVLKNKDFQDLISSLRPGGDGFRMLEFARLDAQKNLLDEKSKKSAEVVLTKIESIFNTIKSIDAYVEHVALVRQSNLPKALQEIYLDVLSELPIRDAMHFLQNFDANVYEVVRRMNEKLTSRNALHTYDQEYLAVQLLEMDGFAASARRFLDSSRTITDEVDFVEATYRAKVLPEFSLKIKDDLGKETNQYKYREYKAFKDKQQVFISFRTSGSNPNLDSISDLSLKCGDLRWTYDSTKTEAENLLDFYRNVQNIVDKGEAVFITHNGAGYDLDFLQTRMYELMEESYISGLGSPELYQAYQNAKRVKASPEELAEIYEKMQETMDPAAVSLFHNLANAQQWFERNVYYSNLNCTDLLKKFDGVPTVGEYYRDIKERFLMSYMRRQSAHGGKVNLTIDKTFIDKIKSIPSYDPKKLGSTVDSLEELFRTIAEYDNTVFSRTGYAPSGRMLINSDYYKKGIHSSDTATRAAHEVTIKDTSKLLNLTEQGRWTYLGTELPETVATADEAVRYLRSTGVEYAPEWKALSAEQQLSTYPVMINGKVSLQQIEGTSPFIIKKYVDMPLVNSFFNTNSLESGKSLLLSLKQQHHYTLIAEQASEILSQITDPGAIDEIASVIERLWDTVISYTRSYKDSWSIYKQVRDDLDIYQKYAILAAMLQDTTAGTPNGLLKKEIKAQAGAINISEYTGALGIEIPNRPIDLSKDFYFKRSEERLSYSKMKDLDGFLKNPEYPRWFRYQSKRSLGNPNVLLRETYHKKLAEVRKDVTISYSEATEIAYDAYRDAIKALNKANLAEYNLQKEIVSSKNKILFNKHKAEIDAKNAATKEYLHKKYLKELEEYNAWWKDLKDSIKTVEEFEKTKPENVLENELRVQASKFLYNPNYRVSQKSSFRKLYEANRNATNLGYNDTIFSKRSYIDHIYMSEERGVVGQARDFFDAIEEVNKNVLESTKAFKTALEAPKSDGTFRSIYAPGMQRHATLGMSLIELNNKVIKLTEKFRDGPEFDAFISCDRQVVNNLEDLCLRNVLHLDANSLISFVQHQGKGVVVIPVGKYLTENTAHNFDLRLDIQAFLLQYNNYNSDVLGVKRAGDNLILYIKDYNLHAKKQDIPRASIASIDIDEAFKKAYGYPVSKLDPNAFKAELASIQVRYSYDNFKYQEQLNLLHNKYAKQYGMTTKQSAFLLQHYDDIEELRKAYKAHFDSLERMSVDYDAQYAYKQGGYGRTMDIQTYKNVIEKLPTSVRKEMGLLEDLEIDKVFNTVGGDVFNFTTLGRANYRLDMEPYASSNYQSVMANTYRSLAYNLSAATQYAQFYFDDSPWALKNFFQFAQSDEEMLAAIKYSDAYTVSTLQINQKGLPVVKEIKIDTVDDLREALNKNAIITPTVTYGSIAQTLNNKRWNTPVLKALHKIVYYTKMSMLIWNPGFVFRNIIDSSLKNVLIAKDKNAVLTNYFEAIDLHYKYQEVVDMLFAIDKEHPFRPDTLNIVLNDSTCPLTEAQFIMIHSFYENGPSAGSIRSIEEWHKVQSLKKGTLKNSVVQRTIDALMTPTKDVEDITRFAAYIEATKRGLTNIDAFELIRRTHFDYGTKTNAQYLLEFVFPFYSFKLKNFEFWLHYASENPSVTYKLLQLTTNEWNWEDIDFDKIQYYESQLNHMTQANIKLNEKGLTLKISPSIMDPVNLILNPLENLSGNVAPWVQPIVDAIQQDEPYGYDKLAGTVAGAALATVPGMGMAGMALATGSQYASRMASGKRAYDRTGSVLPLVLPSVFGSVKTPTQYGKASYTNSRSFMDAEKRRPRRVNIYNKYYTDTGKNRWKIRFYPLDAATVQFRIRDNYNRFR
jgi:hypothetical protein